MNTLLAGKTGGTGKFSPFKTEGAPLAAKPPPRSPGGGLLTAGKGDPEGLKKGGIEGGGCIWIKLGQVEGEAGVRGWARNFNF